ncbi:zinc ribbon domain-containing protein [Cupriavidus plantarum]|uniref:zinc ribbon domain-containing protein n=2 Tax=Cupriavidus plantarum TaxID=942865 RepID=UPI00339D5C9D
MVWNTCEGCETRRYRLRGHDADQTPFKEKEMGFLEKLLGRHGGGHHGNVGKHGSRSGHYSGGHDGYDRGYGPQSGAPITGRTGQSCSNCGTIGAQGARFCQQCGSSLMPLSCSQCGTALPNGAKFCVSCGKAAQ